MENRALRPLQILLGLTLSTFAGLWIWTLPIPLNGTHQWRQSDTLITAYYYCTEDARFGFPRVAARDGTDGVAIGEFPLFSALVGLSCRGLGGWSESAPKIINLLFLAGAFFFWGLFLRRRWGAGPHDTLFWALAFLMMPLHLNFLTIPMPEATAICLFGLAAWLWSDPRLRERPWLDAIASFVFILAFMVRPYHIWLLFVLAPNRARMAQVLSLCIAGFFGWYKWWAAQATSLHGYFGIGFESLGTILAALPRMIRAIPDRIIDQTLIVGLWPLWLGARRAPLWGLGFLASWGSMMVLKPTHLPAHAYYLMNAGLFAAVLMFLGWRSMSSRAALVTGGLFVLASVATVQHNFHPDRRWPQIERVIGEAARTPADAKVVTYLGPNPQWLYDLKRQGTRRDPEDFKGPGSCPDGMKYFLREDEAGELEFAPCGG